jgi:hypothetical protein
MRDHTRFLSAGPVRGCGRNAITVWQDLGDHHGFARIPTLLRSLRATTPTEVRVVIT